MLTKLAYVDSMLLLLTIISLFLNQPVIAGVFGGAACILSLVIFFDSGDRVELD